MRSGENDREFLTAKLAELEAEISPLREKYGHLVEDTLGVTEGLIKKLEQVDNKLAAKLDELNEIAKKSQFINESTSMSRDELKLIQAELDSKADIANKDARILGAESAQLNQEIDSYNEAEHQHYLHLKHEIHLCQSQLKKGPAASAKAFEVQATASRHIITTVNLLTGLIQTPSNLQAIQDQYGYKAKKIPDSEDSEITFTSKDKPDIRLTKGAIYGDIKTTEDAKLIGEVMANIFLKGIAGRILHHIVIEKSDPNTTDAAIQELERIYAKVFKENGFDNIQINGKTPSEHLSPVQAALSKEPTEETTSPAPRSASA